MLLRTLTAALSTEAATSASLRDKPERASAAVLLEEVRRRAPLRSARLRAACRSTVLEVLLGLREELFRH